MKHVLGIILGLSVGMSGHAAWADDATWAKTCPKDSPCYVEQVAVSMPQKAMMLQVRFDLQGDKGQVRMLVTAPLGIVLPAGIQLAVDGGKAIGLPFDRCTQTGCVAFAVLDAIAREQFEKGKILNVRYVADKVPLDFPMHLDGLAAALKALVK